MLLYTPRLGTENRDRLSTLLGKKGNNIANKSMTPNPQGKANARSRNTWRGDVMKDR